MRYCLVVEVDAEIQAAGAAVIAGFVGEYFVVVEAETAKVGQTWKVVVVDAAAAAAISVATAGGVVAQRDFAVTFEWLGVVVVLSVAGFAATTAMEIVAIVSVVAAAVSVRGQLAGLSVAEIVSLVVRMSMGMYSQWLTGYLAGVGYLLKVTVVAEADHMPLAVVQTDL